MADSSKKKISEKPFLVFLLTFVGLAVFLTILALFNETSIELVVGTYFLFGGTIVAGVGFALLNKGSGDKWDGYNQSNYTRNDEYFKRVRTHEKPLERIAWAVILASILIAVSGYFLNVFFVD
jgi:hypothetical protein